MKSLPFFVFWFSFFRRQQATALQRQGQTAVFFSKKPYIFLKLKHGKQNYTKYEYADADNRINLIKNEKNLGLVETLNKCLALAKGKYIARHDCDDYNDLTRFEKQVAYFEDRSELLVLGTATYLFDETGMISAILVL